MNTMSAEMQMLKARTKLIMKEPFFGLLSLKMELLESEALPTMGTDGKLLIYNPKWINALGFEELKGVIAHEVSHVVLKTSLRRKGRDKKLWNIASDVVINIMLQESGFKLPGNKLLGPLYDRFRGCNTDQVYNALAQDSSESNGNDTDGNNGNNGNDENDKNDSKGKAVVYIKIPEFGNQESCGDPGGCGEVFDAPSGENQRAEYEEAEREVDKSIMQAALGSKSIGKLPGMIEELINNLRSPVQDWKEILRNFVEVVAKNDYSWTLPNMRYLHTGAYLPRLRSQEVGLIACIIDTSGSLSTNEFEQFLGEMENMLDSYPGMELLVLEVDTQVNGTPKSFTHEDVPLSLKLKGRGGTDFRPGFRWLEKEGIEPKALIYFTDLWCHSYPSPPDYPVLWAATSRYSAPPFGEVISIVIDNKR